MSDKMNKIQNAISQQQAQEPPQPETIMIEASARNAIRTTNNYDEWESAVVPTPIYKGDEISVNMSFLDARGTGTEILEFSSGGDSQNDKQKILFETYLVDCGTNDLNKGKDWVNYMNTRDANQLNPASTTNPVMENGKTYKPCLAVRWDRLLSRDTTFVKGGGFYHNIGGNDNELTGINLLTDPMIIAKYCINYRPDPFCDNLFNSYDAYGEVSQYNVEALNRQPNYTRVATKEADGGGSAMRQVNSDGATTLSKYAVNLDALPYWEIRRNPNFNRVEIATTEDVFSAVPNGTAVSILTEWTHKLASVLAENNQDVPFHTLLASQGGPEFQIESDRNRKTNGLTGQFVVSEYIIPKEGEWETNVNYQIWNNDPLDIQHNFTGQKAYLLCFQELITDETSGLTFTNYNTPLSYGDPVSKANGSFLIEDGNRGGKPQALWTSAEGYKYINATKTSRSWIYEEAFAGRVRTDNLQPIDIIIDQTTPTAPAENLSRYNSMPFDIFVSFSPYGVRSVSNTLTRPYPTRLYPRCKNSNNDLEFGAGDCSLSDMTYSGAPSDQGNSLWHALYTQNGSVENNTFQEESNPNVLSCWKQQQWATYRSSLAQLMGYDTYNNYQPLSTTIQVALPMVSGSVLIDKTSLIANQRDQLGALIPDGTIVVINEGTIHEEIALTATTLFDTGGAGATGHCIVYFRARNISGNPNLTDNVLYDPADPNTPNTFSYNPVAWCNDAKYQHGINTSFKFFIPREGMNMKIMIQGKPLLERHEYGIPITDFTPYRGSNTENPEITNIQLVPDEVLDTYEDGAIYCLYARDQTNQQVASPPESLVNNNNYTQSVSSPMGFRFFPLIAKKDGVVNNPRQMAMSAQISSASAGTRFAHGTFGDDRPRTSYNPHTVLGMLYFSWFDENRQVGSLDAQMNPNATVKLFNNTYYGWSPDAYEFYDTSQSSDSSTTTLKTFNSESIDHICGYIPLMREFTFETPKPYLTPTDLSNYFTEEIHKTTNVISMYDGTEIKDTKNRGLLQNETLFPVYGSWGKCNIPTSGTLGRDYNTFTQCGGYAIGSVIGLDGNTMPTDWKEKMGNSTIKYQTAGHTNEDVPNINYSYLTNTLGSSAPRDYPPVYKEDTYGLYPRNDHNLLHLWNFNSVPQANASFVPTYNFNQAYTFDPNNPDAFVDAYSNTPTYTWNEYPVAPSALPTNDQLSNSITGSGAPTSIDPTNGANSDLATNLANRQDPNYGGAVNTVYTNVAIPTEIDPPNATGNEWGAREDNTYRETTDYPIEFLSGHYQSRYLKIGQYCGTDNFVMTYNANVSAFEYQFLHQPFSTTFEITNGSATGGQNAIRIYDQVPQNVSNWERFSGVNIINWTTPITRKNAFTARQVIYKQPSFSIKEYPNGINPVKSFDDIGKAYMNKLGFKDEQIAPVVGTALGWENNVVGLGVDTLEPLRYVYEPRGTTGADTDIADAIIQTSFSAEDNPNITAHNGFGNLMYYPAGVDTGNLTMKAKSNTDSSVVFDFAYSRYAQRGGLKSHNHGKAMGLPNTAGTPQVRDDREVPRQLNIDGEQRSGYTLEIGSSAIRALDLPIKLTDGYYYILCDDIINDAQFYISNNNGMVIPAVSIVSKTYVSGDFYTTFQSPISWFAKKDYVLSRLRIAIRTSTMEVPTNLGSNSSVIFSIRRFSPPKPTPPLTTSEQQNNAYLIMEQEEKSARSPKKVSFAVQTKQDILNIANEVLAPDPQADHIQQYGQMLNMDELRANPQQWARNNPELAIVLQHAQALGRAEDLVEQGIDPNVARLGEARANFAQGLNAVMVGRGGGSYSSTLEPDELEETPPSPTPRFPQATRQDVMARMEAERFAGGIGLTPRALRQQARGADAGGAKPPSSSGYETGSRDRSSFRTTPFSDSLSVSTMGADEHRLVAQGLVRPRTIPRPQVVNPHSHHQIETRQERAEREHYERRGAERRREAPQPHPSQRTERQTTQQSQTKTGIPKPS